jgi:hypothetical protein
MFQRFFALRASLGVKELGGFETTVRTFSFEHSGEIMGLAGKAAQYLVRMRMIAPGYPACYSERRGMPLMTSMYWRKARESLFRFQAMQ